MTDQDNQPVKGWRKLGETEPPNQSSVPEQQNPAAYPPPANAYPPPGSYSIPQTPAPQPWPPTAQPIQTAPTPGSSASGSCAHCGSALVTGALYCPYCGKRVQPEVRPSANSWHNPPGSAPASYQQPGAVPQARPAPPRPIPTSAPALNLGGLVAHLTTGDLIALAGALAAICFFFFPWIVFRIGGGEEALKISISGWVYLTNGTPDVSGGWGLGEWAANLYANYNVSDLIYESLPDDQKMAMNFSRFLTFLVFAAALVSAGLAAWGEKSSFSHKSRGWLLAAAGGGGAAIMLLCFLVIQVGFRSEASDLEMLLNAMMSVSNPLTFWLNVVGLAAVAAGGISNTR